MAYNIYQTDGTPLVTVPDNTLNTTASSLTLIGRNAVNFGLSIDQNFINLLQNFSKNTAPINPLKGQLWYDTNLNGLRVFNGTIWKTITPPFDGSAGTATVTIGSRNTDVSVTLSQNKIISVSSYNTVLLSDLPDYVVINDTRYSFAPLFPAGIRKGINIATYTDQWLGVYGTASSANVLTTERTIYVTGSMKGNVAFDGSSDVNLRVTMSNVYVGNSTVTTRGVWTKVTVNDGGQVIQGNLLASSDVVNALGYEPLDVGNVNVAISGDVVGVGVVSGTGNILINSNLTVISNLTAGTYNSVTVDTKGRVTGGTIADNPPVGSVFMFTETIIPYGYAKCDGQTVVTPTGDTVTTPVVPNYNVVVGGITITSLQFVMKVFNPSAV